MFADKPEVLAIVRSHHERWDGAGYPDGLAGEAIPMGARILAVADSYDAMTSARPYRPGMAPERALKILHEGAKTQWDPAAVAAFLTLAREKALPPLPSSAPSGVPPPANASPSLTARQGAERKPTAPKDAAVVYLVGDLDAHKVNRIQGEIGTLISQGKLDIVIDLRRAGMPDRAAVHQLQSEVPGAGGSLTLRHVPRIVQIMLDAADLARTLKSSQSS